MNYSVLMGRMTADPEVRYTNSQKSVLSFNVAVDNPGKDAGASFIPCVAWEKTAEFIAKYFSKGTPIAIEGRLQTSNYTAKDGSKRTDLKLIVNRVHFCGSKKESKNEFQSTDEAVPSQWEQPTQNKVDEFSQIEFDNDEDLPF